jgi:hypothetical protein
MDEVAEEYEIDDEAHPAIDRMQGGIAGCVFEIRMGIELREVTGHKRVTLLACLLPIFSFGNLGFRVARLQDVVRTMAVRACCRRAESAIGQRRVHSNHLLRIQLCVAIAASFVNRWPEFSHIRRKYRVPRMTIGANRFALNFAYFGFAMRRLHHRCVTIAPMYAFF